MPNIPIERNILCRPFHSRVQAKVDQAQQYIKDKELDRGLLYQRQIEKVQGEKEKQDSDKNKISTMHAAWSHQSTQDRPRRPSGTTAGMVFPSCGDRSMLEMTVNFQASARPNRGPLKLGRSIEVPEESSEDTIPMSDFERVSDKESSLKDFPTVLPNLSIEKTCRAPIASLDCMDDFSATSQQMLDQATRLGSSYVGNHLSMHASVTPGLRYKNLGKSGLRVSNVGLGTWAVFGPTVAEETSEEIINLALDSGINLFDLSEAHSGTRAETELGRILQRRSFKRSSIIITTKIYWSTKCDERGLSRKHIIESVKGSLERLQVDYVDIVMLHKVDHMCPMEELVRAMNHIINKGWAMYWGTARWSAAEVMEAYTNCRQFNCVTPIVEQTEYHMFCREKPELYMPELYNKIGVGMMVWSAITTGKGLSREDVPSIFARSRFNRKYSSFSWAEDETAGDSTATRERGQVDESRRHCEKLREISDMAANLNCTVSQLAVAWCLKNESVHCLLLGAVTVEQLYENIHALQILPQLSPMAMAEIERILENKPQRPPVVSTLALRSQAQPGATPHLDSPKDVTVECGDAAAETPTKEHKSNAFCELQ
ncbi:potassium voltage-gated channel subfamily A regulatory beta subunit hyperkinetic isoform X2 [Arctopsyche grandis]|uniref:potassium voltage-gated channel subfamily A regulatory beta subunit hyperkinetic isoform X2 n=1 Tax=Arctopsyche grandis TaxID=121162 RepID=UPI00406D76A1